MSIGRRTLMPYLQCTDPECGHVWFESSRLAEGATCEECGGDTILADDLDDAPPSPPEEVPRLAHMRERARAVAAQYGLTVPPIKLRPILAGCGLRVVRLDGLGSLNARLNGDVIEVAAGDAFVVQRFSIAHELGHYFLGTTHVGDGTWTAEREADAFANELLVPGPLLLKELRQMTSRRALADRFEVSVTVLGIAAQNHKVASRLTD